MTDVDAEREFDRVLAVQDSAEIMALRAEVERLRAALAAHVTLASPQPEASTATANQAYTWIDGDVWAQYCGVVGD